LVSASRAFASWYAIRSRTIACVRSNRASSSGVVFGIFRFFAIFLLEQLPDAPHLVMNVAEQHHDRCDVAVVERLHTGIVVT
jgi:hypothetical protein